MELAVLERKRTTNTLACKNHFDFWLGLIRESCAKLFHQLKSLQKVPFFPWNTCNTEIDLVRNL